MLACCYSSPSATKMALKKQREGYMHAVFRIHEKWRHGLLLYWMFERLTSILAKIGIQLHPSVIYREFTSQAPTPEIGLPDCTWEFAADRKSTRLNSSH